MNIAFITIYDVYNKDRCFNETSCKIGENLLLPYIKLKEFLEKQGHNYHTVDMYNNLSDIDYVIFQDIKPSYLQGCKTMIDILRYIYHKQWKNDILQKVIKILPKEKRLLIMVEPPINCSTSYLYKVHRHFNTIFTWNDDLVDNIKYFKLNFPQIIPSYDYRISFNEKKFLTMICGNKTSSEKNELYSMRKKIIEYFENNDECTFDLYGFGWNASNLKNYQGIITSKLKTLSQYKFSICFENMSGVNGYVTEKIFDCFFAGCVPVYLGADNIVNYIPEDSFIDMRKFTCIKDLVHFLKSISIKQYEKYLNAAHCYINSSFFKETFSVEHYINTIYQKIIQ